MSFDNPTDSPIKRFSTFWLWLLIVASFGLITLVLAPWLKNRSEGTDEAASARLEIKKSVEEAQAPAREKISGSFETLATSLSAKPSASGKALPAPVEAAAPAAEEKEAPAEAPATAPNKPAQKAKTPAKQKKKPAQTQAQTDAKLRREAQRAKRLKAAEAKKTAPASEAPAEQPANGQ